jgi:hypothetical protein
VPGSLTLQQHLPAELLAIANHLQQALCLFPGQQLK